MDQRTQTLDKASFRTPNPEYVSLTRLPPSNVSVGQDKDFAAPLFILAPPRSLTSIICGMIGQHPQLYGLPELQLFGFETMTEWRAGHSQGTYFLRHGLLRAVAQLFFGAQTEHTIQLAQAWIRRHAYFTTGMMFETVIRQINPRIAVEKSPAVVYRIESMARMIAMFPDARFLHLVRHPRAYGESVLKAIKGSGEVGPVPVWLSYLASYPNKAIQDSLDGPDATDIDPQRGWHALHNNICEFLKQVPAEQQFRMRGEDLLNSPAPKLAEIAGWLGVENSPHAIEEMQHPERSPYACFGPPGARNGNDVLFLKEPAIRPDRAKPQSLAGPLTWREDGKGFHPKVIQMAQHFGYT